MKLLDEKFEYLIQNVMTVLNRELDALDYESDEYKELVQRKEYYTLLINELGSVGWELIASSDNSYKGRTIERLTFKRSSKSANFGTGMGVDLFRIQEVAKEQAKIFGS